jgi:hypothetical protein
VLAREALEEAEALEVAPEAEETISAKPPVFAPPHVSVAVVAAASLESR